MFDTRGRDPQIYFSHFATCLLVPALCLCQSPAQRFRFCFGEKEHRIHGERVSRECHRAVWKTHLKNFRTLYDIGEECRLPSRNVSLDAERDPASSFV
jgi:hypothetical protein